MIVKIPVITIDGAGGTGKGVVTQQIAKQLGWKLLDSGALYRVLALSAQKNNIALEDSALLEQLAIHLDVQFVADEIGQFPRIFLDGEDVTGMIRSEKIANAASQAGAISGVRQALLDRQRAFRQAPGLVTDGRDMGTVVFPDADLKVFLTASPEKRAIRRYHQLKELGIHVNLDDLVEELKERDRRDQGRAIAPLRPAADAFCIDTDHLSVAEVVERVMTEVRKKFF